MQNLFDKLAAAEHSVATSLYMMETDPSDFTIEQYSRDVEREFAIRREIGEALDAEKAAQLHAAYA